jgi:hypothetical protein
MSEDIRNTFIAFSGASPGISTSLTDLSYTSLDGKRIYLNFQDIDSTGIEPATGLELRFSVTKKFGAIATTENPSSTFIDASSPKTLQLILSDANRIVDYARNGRAEHLKSMLPYLIPKAKAPNTQMIDNDAEVLDLKLDSPEDIKKASEMIIKAMIAGRISVAEAEGMIKIVERYGEL